LASLDLRLAEKQSLDRIQAAIVVLASADLPRFQRATKLAERDWRDVLVAAGLADGD
jgi:hypothetical protein